ncbi:MAG: Maf family protein [Oscillospiraceae bacterium]|nr:Maf family protein [Oscillospiraceae bacterium]
MAFILGSGSPRRQELLKLVVPAFTIKTADVDESQFKADTPQQLVERLAQEKCKTVAGLCTKDDVIIGCDTLVDLNGCVLGKPANKTQAREMITALAGNTHLVHTGVCIIKAQLCHSFVETSKVTFNPMSAEEIEAYINTEEPYDKAGAYGIQGFAAKHIGHIEGCYFNIMGLPVARLYTALKKLGLV